VCLMAMVGARRRRRSSSLHSSRCPRSQR
jgi:hypothetical protein